MTKDERDKQDLLERQDSHSERVIALFQSAFHFYSSKWWVPVGLKFFDKGVFVLPSGKHNSHNLGQPFKAPLQYIAPFH